MTGLPRQIAVLAAVAFNLALNGLAGAGVLFGVQTGEVSDSIQTGVTPAGWAFSIWSVIFLGVLVFGVWQARPGARTPRYDALAVPFIAANLLNGLWQIPWSLRLFGVAVVVIVGILASLAWLYVRLDRMGMSTAERWMLGVPASLFFAWLCVAAPVNVTVALAAAGWTGGALWPPLFVLVVAAVGVALLRQTGDVAFAAVLLWAFAAILAKNGAGAPMLIGALAAAAAAVVVTTILAIRAGASPLPVTR
ncbi:MAG TPA: tryptophan-rich sensory protein [Bacteroidetes bacterium]|nr:tryptophan-rich sensory protein [Bacteroidota bacterium]HIL58213.1 tryptophan-rich sensory protein [Rhodothermales bacterium]